MYIWILLATFMVALSFFNLSPRPDKDHALNEIKAATIVNRFKAEHKAMVKTIECELIKQSDNNNWDGDEYNRTSATGAVELPHNINLPYTKFACHLPIGYQENSNVVSSTHLLFCLKHPIEQDNNYTASPINGQTAEADSVGPNGYVACNQTATNYSRYIVSFAPIEGKWLAKNGTKVPVPMLISFLSKNTSSGTVFGWTECDNDGCMLHGVSAKGGRLAWNSVRDADGNKQQFFQYLQLGKNAIFWNNAKFRKTCIEDNPTCLFSYELAAVSESADHCDDMIARNSQECAGNSGS